MKPMTIHPLTDPMAVSSRNEALRGLYQLPKDAILEFDCRQRPELQFHVVTIKYNSVDITNLVALVINAQIHYGGLTADVNDIEERLRANGIVWLQSLLVRT